MARSVKTRKQKKLADSRRKAMYSLHQPPPILATKIDTAPQVEPKPIQKASISTIDYRYLRKDLLKTILLTGSFVVIELLVKFFAKGI